jgi:hypothetical protein
MVLRSTMVLPNGTLLKHSEETVMTRINQKHDAPSKNVVESLQGLAAMEEHFGLLSCADNDLFTKVTSPH